MKRPIVLLGFLCAVLASLIVIGLGAGGTGESPAQGLMIGRPPVSAQATDAGTGHEDWIAIAMARPLFSASRRPTRDAVVEAPTGPDGLPRLTAVLSGPFGERAIFAGPEGGKPLVVSTGDAVGDYRVLRIENGEVTLKGAGQTRQLRPSFADAAQAAVPPGVAVPVGLPPAMMPPGAQPRPVPGQRPERRR